MRYIEIDAVKGIAILGVIIAHIDLKNRFVLQETIFFIDNLQVVFGACVISFFFCAGFLSKSINSKEAFYSFLLKRLKRLVIPSLVFSITYKLILNCLSSFGFLSVPTVIPNNFNGILNFIFFPVGPQFYFLYYLFFITIIVSFMELFISKPFIFYGSLIVFPAIYLFIDAPEVAYGGDLNLIPIYMISYITGSNLKGNIIKNKNVMMFAIFSILFSFFTNFNNIVFLQILVTILLWAFFKKFAVLTSFLNKLKLGKYSSSIYVFHAPIILPVVGIICTKFIKGPIVILPILILTVLFCVFIDRIVHKYEFLRFYRF